MSGVEALARGFHHGQDSPVGHTHVGRRGDLRMVQFHTRCHCVETAESAMRAIENLTPADRLAIAGITEERLIRACHVAGLYWFGANGLANPTGKTEAQAILAALTGDRP